MVPACQTVMQCTIQNYFRDDIYIQVISHCMQVNYFSRTVLYHNGISGMRVCVYFYSKLQLFHSLNQPAILCSYTWVSIYTNLHCNMVANNMLLTSAHAAHQCSVWSNVSHEPNILASRLLPVLCAISNIVRMDSSYDNMQG